MVDSVLEVQNIKLPDSGGVTSSTAITLDASGNTTATLSSSSNIKAPLNASGDAPVYACRAWVNFDGTASMAIGSSYGPDAPPADYSSPNPIRASGNVSSITDNGTGDYTVNFTTAMPDANYATGAQTNLDNAGSNWGYIIFERFRSTSSYRFMVGNTSYAVYDCEYVSLSFIR